MSGVASKNLFELLGNDHDQDSDREQSPGRAIDKPSARSGKRNDQDAAPPAGQSTGTASRGGRGGRQGQMTGNDAAIGDRDAGSTANRRHGADDGERQDRHRGGRDHTSYSRGNRGRGGTRGGKGAYLPDDRHSRSGFEVTHKQEAQGWGETSGQAEYDDEKAGDAIARTEAADGFGAEASKPTGEDGQPMPEETGAGATGQDGGAAAAEAEPQEVKKSYEEYLAEQAEKRLQLGSDVTVRKPNEGSKENKDWEKAKALKKDDEPEDLFAGSGGKARREREKTAKKQVLDIDHAFTKDEPRDPRRRDNRGGFGGNQEGGSFGERGSRGGRGGDRGDRGDRGGRGGRGRGDFRGGYRGDHRGGRGGEFRGGRGGGRGGGHQNAPPVVTEEAFPSLGGS